MNYKCFLEIPKKNQTSENLHMDGGGGVGGAERDIFIEAVTLFSTLLSNGVVILVSL